MIDTDFELLLREHHRKLSAVDELAAAAGTSSGCLGTQTPKPLKPQAPTLPSNKEL